MEYLFKGLSTAIVTPLNSENKVDYSAFKKQIDRQILCGATALVFLGTTGESSTISLLERKEIVSFAVKYVNKRCKVIIGCGSNNTALAIKYAKYAESAGADGILCVTPYYNKCTQQGIIEYYKDIAENTTLPIICYNVPSRTGVNILPETAGILASIKGICGIKECSGDLKQIIETKKAIGDKIALYSGDDFLNLPILAVGGVGIISVISNVIPRQVNDLLLAIDKDISLANSLNEKMYPLIKAMFIEVNPCPVKYALKHLGLDSGYLRKPLLPLSKTNEKIIENALKDYLEKERV